jgi:heme-degrading monooxygenase HmoA
MHELVETIPGFISIKGFTAEDGEEIDIVRFESEQALEAWRNQLEHRIVQALGRTALYDYYHVEAWCVFREYEFTLGSPEPTSGLDVAVRLNPNGAGSTPPSGPG